MEMRMLNVSLLFTFSFWICLEKDRIYWICLVDQVPGIPLLIFLLLASPGQLLEAGLSKNYSSLRTGFLGRQ